MNFITKYDIRIKGDYADAFVGMNSGNGFVCLFDDIFQECDLQKVYVIKGAPGTGKSTFMRELSNFAKSCGFCVNNYLCSSDYNSLDAVMIDSKICVVDGTPPHSYELKFPGVVSEIIDYTKFWDNSKLEKYRDDIIYLSNKKTLAYTEAYSKLKCEMNLIADRINSAQNIISVEKLRSHIGRLVASLGKFNNNDKQRRIATRAVGMKGRVRIENPFDQYEKVYSISDVYGTAYIYMAELFKQLKLLKTEMVYSVDPICPTLICEIAIPSQKVVFTIEDDDNYNKKINMTRFIEHDSLADLRGFLRLSDKCCKLFSSEADNSLQIAGETHFKIEEIYGSAMNFDFLKTYSEMKIHEIIEKLQ